MRYRSIVTTTALTAVAALAGTPAFACGGGHSDPFKGSYSGNMQVTAGGPSGPTQATYSGTGTVSPLGRSTLTGLVNITGPAQACSGFDASHTETLAARNGEKIYVSETEESCTTDGATFNCTGTYTITGGTGEYARAKGTGSWTGHLVFDTAAGTGTFQTGYDGSISN